MSGFERQSAHVGLGLLFSALIVGCTPTPIPTASPSETASPSVTEGVPRFVIECVGPEGIAIGPFTRLEEAWASTNYVRIDHCTASLGTDRPIELTAEEQRIAETASADMPQLDQIELYLRTLATCVRVAPTSEQGLSTLPTSLLRATLELCPEAPHAGLVTEELDARTR